LALSGKTILCTRPEIDSAEFISSLRITGANVISFPVIEIVPITDFTELDEKLAKLKEYSGVIFTSSNAANIFFNRILKIKTELNNIIYAVGEKTAETIKGYGYDACFVPEQFTSKELAGLIKENAGHNDRFLFPRGNLSMRAIVDKVENVDEVVVYETRRPEQSENKDEIDSILKKGEADCIAFFSPSAVTNFMEIFPDFKQNKASIAVIGNTTFKRAEQSGLVSEIKAERSTSEGLSEAIINYYNER